MGASNRVVLVTGAASGIGRALCLLMGGADVSLGLIDRNETGLRELEDSLRSRGVRCAAAVADVRDRTQIATAIRSLASELGPVDLLVSSAGICGFSTVEDLAVEKLEEIMQVNFLGVVYSIEAVLPEMLRRKQGHIVGIASLAAFRGLPFESAYCASKAALASYLESLRPALRRRGILVTTIFPGFVRTPLLDGLLATAGMASLTGSIAVEHAARKIAAAIRQRRRESCFPWTTSFLTRLACWLPPAVYDRVMTRIAARIPLPY